MIVVDDFSTDETPEVIAELPGNVRVLRNETNIERGASRNRGAAAARAPVLAFLDSDDVWLPDKLAHQLPRVRQGVAVVTGVRMIDERGQPTGRVYIPPATGARQLLTSNPFFGSPSSLLVTKADFEAAGGFPEDREVQGSEDWLFLNALVRAGCSFATVSEVLIAYRVHPDNSTGRPDRVARSMWAARQKLIAEADVNPAEARRLEASTAGMIARQYARERRLGEAWSWTRRALKTRTARAAAETLSLIPTVFVGRSVTTPAAPSWRRGGGWRREAVQAETQQATTGGQPSGSADP